MHNPCEVSVIILNTFKKKPLMLNNLSINRSHKRRHQEESNFTKSLSCFRGSTQTGCQKSATGNNVHF